MAQIAKKDPGTYEIIGAANEEPQNITYLKAIGLETGLLLNFDTDGIEYKHFASKDKKSVQSVDIIVSK